MVDGTYMMVISFNAYGYVTDIMKVGYLYMLELTTILWLIFLGIALNMAQRVVASRGEGHNKWLMNRFTTLNKG